MCLCCESHQRWWQQTAQRRRWCRRLNETQMLLVLCVRAAQVWGLPVSLPFFSFISASYCVANTCAGLWTAHRKQQSICHVYRTLITAQCFVVSRCRRSWKNGKFNYFFQMRDNKLQHSLPWRLECVGACPCVCVVRPRMNPPRISVIAAPAKVYIKSFVQLVC